VERKEEGGCSRCKKVKAAADYLDSLKPNA